MTAADGQQTPPSADMTQGLTWALMLILVLTAWRIGVLFISPIGLYPEEAQYWLWSRDLAFGYFSKPPMIAWLIGATTRIGGDGEAFVRLSAPLMHAVAALGVMATARTLYGLGAALLAAALYALMPAVQLSSFVIATDAPLLAFLAVALFAYVRLAAAEPAHRWRWALGLGVALGLAFLAKYAALYFLIGVALHLLWDREARRVWSWPLALAAVAGFALVAAPNIAWNLSHGLATVEHTVSNAGLSQVRRFQVSELGEFLVSQFGVFGPIPFVVLIGGAVLLARRGRLEGADKLLLAMAAPPLVIITVQAFVTHANANWAAAAYVPGSVLVAGWLVRWGRPARPWVIATLALQGVVAIAFLVLATRPSLGDGIGLANSLKRARGWETLTNTIVERARQENVDRPLTAVVVQDRFTFNSAAYYGRDAFGRDLPPLRMWVHGRAPENQAEAVAALTPQTGARVLAVSLDPVDTPRMRADFARTLGDQIVSVWLDRRNSRRAELFVAEGFRPAPRR